jgi:branched-chain amino acid transport system permease protein
VNIAGQLLFDGFAMGLVYVILASGMVLITSVNKILFLAYGMFYTLGAYMAWSMLNYAHLSYALDVLIGTITAAVVGMASYVLIFQRLQKSKGGFISTLIGSLGLMLIMNQGVLIIWGTKERSVPQLFHGALRVGGVNMTAEKLIMIAFGIVLTVGMFVLVMKTKFGRSMRATSFKPEIALLHGISAPAVSLITLGMATGIAGLSGALLAPAYGMSGQMGNNVVWTILLMMMVGGMDSLFGAVIGGIVIGQILSFGLYYLGQVTQIILFVVIGVVLYLKPNGLLGKGVDVGI